MVVGVLTLLLYLPESHSLKGKRSVVRTVKARVSNKFNVSIAETGVAIALNALQRPGRWRAGSDLRHQRMGSRFSLG